MNGKCKRKILYSRIRSINLSDNNAESKYRLFISYNYANETKRMQDNGQTNVSTSAEAIYIFGGEVINEAYGIMQEKRNNYTANHPTNLTKDESFDYIFNKNNANTPQQNQNTNYGASPYGNRIPQNQNIGYGNPTRERTDEQYNAAEHDALRRRNEEKEKQPWEL